VFAALAGVDELDRWGRRSTGLRLSRTLLVAAAAAVAGCSGSGSPISRNLLDGSHAHQPAVDLEGIDGPALQTRLRVWRAGRFDARRLAGCFGSPVLVAKPRIVVERIGATGASITFRDPSGRTLLGCDDALGPKEKGHPWCGEVADELESGRLTDPRLDVNCRTVNRRPIGFAWIKPGRGTRYLSIDQPSYSEVYTVAGRLPVRVSTAMDDVSDEVTIAYAEYDRRGRLLRRAVLRSIVAG
jgi:hypothetical protein